MDNNAMIAEWAGWRREDDKGEWWSVPGIGRMTIIPALDHAGLLMMGFWQTALFPLIEERNVWEQFYRAWLEDNDFDCSQPYVAAIAWAFRKATPVQLAEALVKVIKEGP